MILLSWWGGEELNDAVCSRRVIFVRRVVRVVALRVSSPPPLIIVMTRRAAASSRLVFDKMTRDLHYGDYRQTTRPLQCARGHDEDVIASAVCDRCRRNILIFCNITTSAPAIRLRLKTTIGKCSPFILEFRVSNSEMNRRSVIRLWRVLTVHSVMYYYN